MKKLLNRAILVICLTIAIGFTASAQSWYNSSAYQASAVVYTSHAYLLGFQGYNSSASTVFIQVFNASVLPTNGSVPIIILSVPANSNFTWTSNNAPEYLIKGITIVSSSTGPTLTVTPATAWFNVTYR